MSAVLLPLVWVVLLAGQLIVWCLALRPGRLDHLVPRKLVALRWSAEAAEGPAIALVLGVSLLIAAIAASTRSERLAWSYLGLGIVLIVDGLLTRRLAARLLADLAGRGRLPLPSAVAVHETRRRRRGLLAIVGLSVVTTFPAFANLPTPLFLAYAVLWVVALLTMFVAGIVHLIDASRLLDARRLAIRRFDHPENSL